MNDKKQDPSTRKPYLTPTFTTLDVSEVTAGGGTGFSDDGAGYKQEGGSCLPDAEVSIPPRQSE